MRPEAGLLEGDVVAETLQLAHEAAGVGGTVVTAAEPVGAEVLLNGTGLGQDMPDHDDQGVSAGEDGLTLGSFAEAALGPAELGPEQELHGWTVMVPGRLCCFGSVSDAGTPR